MMLVESGYDALHDSLTASFMFAGVLSFLFAMISTREPSRFDIRNHLGPLHPEDLQEVQFGIF